MPKNKHNQGVEIHYLRSLRKGLGVYVRCGRVVIDDKYTLLWPQVTCKNCLSARPDDTTLERT